MTGLGVSFEVSLAKCKKKTVRKKEMSECENVSVPQKKSEKKLKIEVR